MSPGESDPRSRLLFQSFSIIRRRYLTIGAVALVIIALGLAYVLLATRQYTAAATLEVKREGGNAIGIAGTEGQQIAADQEFYETQYGLLKARSLAERISQDLGLYNDIKFFELYKLETDKLFVDGRPTPATRATRIRVSGAIVKKYMEVDSERLSRLVTVKFTSPDPALSKRVVDMWTRDFIRVTLERRYDATSYARKFLEERLEQLRRRIDESERYLVRYATEAGIVNLPSAPSADGKTIERPLVAADLESLNSELAKATAERIEAESRLSAPQGQVSEALGNAAITQLRGNLAEKRAEYSKMMIQFEPNYPPAKALSAEIAQLDRSVRQEEERVKSTLRKTFDAASERENLLLSRVGSLKNDFLDMRRRSIQYNIYLRDVDTNRQLYDALLQRYKEIGVAGGVGVNNISVVDPAEMPNFSSQPKVLLIIAGSILAGLLLGFGAALLQEQLDQGIADPHEVEEVLGVPLLGTIPLSPTTDLKETLADPKSTLTEAYQSLRMNLSFLTEHGLPRVMAVTSSRPAEGKTTTSFAIASLLARSGAKILLVDADMRSPAVHALLGLSNKAGLSNYLTGDNDLDRLIQKTANANLSVLPSGPQPPSTPELLSGNRLQQCFERLTEQFDHVIVDAPPVLGLADAPLLGNRVEGTLFVIEAHSSSKAMARTALTRMGAGHAPVFGVVLTKFDTRRADFGADYGYGYGYSYSYGKTSSSDA